MSVTAAITGLSPGALPGLRELGDLKRIRSAARDGSIAERLFVDAWAALVRGEPAEDVMAATVAAALVSARMGDLDLAALWALGIADGAAAVLERAFASPRSGEPSVLQSRPRASRRIRR